ncbi:MAG: hypothetical protein RMJ15_07885 [Nitrososphaerota archaeon]|nr:hypothetical protein [Candidatus Bathyarchaeota archaeon]MDW8023637.1 hypothetical protein [Nitrososphaerota archaeon]
MDELIKHLLSAGGKTPKELKEAVIGKTRVSDRVYYRHLKKLLERREVEEKYEDEDGGRKIKKYVLRRENKLLLKAESKGVAIVGFPKFAVSRRLLELASWIKQQPEEWIESEDVEKAKQLLTHYLVPEIKASYEDPDSYVFVWPNGNKSRLNLHDFIHPRFFDLKNVYNALTETREAVFLVSGKVFVGAYYCPFIAEYVTSHEDMEEQMRYIGKPCEFIVTEQPHCVSVAVCKRADNSICVIHVESRDGEIDKAWIKGLAQQLGAKKFQIQKHLSEDLKRKLLVNLREALKQHKLVIPKRYIKLIEELFDYSYQKPSSGYVIALAIAVDLSQKE